MDDEPKSSPVTVRIPDDLLEKLRDRAKAEDRSLASLIVHLARRGMADWAPPGQMDGGDS